MQGNEKPKAQKMDLVYRTLMREKSPTHHYDRKRQQIVNNLKTRDHWPDGMKRPDEYRSFYWTNDLSFCGFATVQRQEKTISMINRALENQNSVQQRRPSKTYRKNSRSRHAST